MRIVVFWQLLKPWCILLFFPLGSWFLWKKSSFVTGIETWVLSLETSLESPVQEGALLKVTWQAIWQAKVEYCCLALTKHRWIYFIDSLSHSLLSIRLTLTSYKLDITMLYCCTQQICLPPRRIIFWTMIVITILLLINRSKLNLYITCPLSESAEIIGVVKV